MVFVIGAAAVAIAGSTVAWIYNSKTEEEKRKHSELKENISRYGQKFKDLAKEHNKNTDKLIFEAFKELKQDYLNHIAFLKKEKKPIKYDLGKLAHAISDELSNKAISPYVRKSLMFENNRVQDAFKRLEAYWFYLDWFEKELEDLEKYKKYHKIFDIQPSELLPKDFLYVGKLATIKENELGNWNLYGQNLELKSIKISGDDYSQKQEVDNLQYYKKNRIHNIPIFIDHKNKNHKFFKASIAKAEIWQSIMTGSQIEAKPKDDEYVNSKQLEVDYKGVRCFLSRDEKKYPLKNYIKSFKLNLKIIENDFLLNNVLLTEKDEISEIQEDNEVSIIFNPERIETTKLNKLEGYLDNFNLSVSDIDIVENYISFQISDLELVCEIALDKGYLVLTEINDGKISSTKSFEPPFYFTFSPKNVYSEELQVSPQKALLNFIEFTNNQAQYIQYSKENNNQDYDFFKKWNKALDFQIASNSYEETTYKFEQISFEEGKLILHVKDDVVINKINRLNKEKKISLAIECKQSEQHPFEVLDIGRLDDILDNDIIVTLYHPSMKDFIFNLRNEFIIKSPTYPSALLKQRNALKDFGVGKIVNSELKTDLISPSIIKAKFDSSWDDIMKNGLKWQNSQLTKNQKKTIEKVLLEKNISLIQGPPGTGKTTIIKEITYQQLKHKPLEKILIVSQQNVAVDNALSRIYTENHEWFEKGKFSFVRIAPNEDKVSVELKNFTIENWFTDYKEKTQKIYSRLLYDNPKIESYCNDWWNLIDQDNLRSVDNEIIEILLKSHNIIGATCVGLANRSIGLDLVEFDIAIIDEAGRATPPELLIPILRAKKVVLIGDHYQLPPTYDRKLIDAINNDNEESLKSFDKDFLAKSFFENLFEQLPDSNKSMLTDQFRMPNEVGELISRLFYKNKLKNGLNKNSNNSYSPSKPIEWIDVKGKQEKKRGNTSSFNSNEVDIIFKKLNEINKKLNQRKLTKSIAIITPYSAQKKEIRNKIKALKLTNISNVKVDTIDSFQGEEAQIVIYSTVRTYGNLSFIIDRKRLNVAISRTQENLIFVGHKSFLQHAKVKGKRNLFAEIIKYIQ